MKKAYIFGSGGHAHVVASILFRRYDQIFFIDIGSERSNVISEQTFFDHIDLYKNEDIYLGIGSSRIRSKLFRKLTELTITPSNCIADHTFVAHDAVLGTGLVICPGAIIGSKARIGNNTIVNTLSSVDHDCDLGEHSQVTVGVTLAGNTKVADNCYFGAKSGTIPGIKVGTNSLVMAGSMLFEDVPENVLVGGNPAKVMHEINRNTYIKKN